MGAGVVAIVVGLVTGLGSAYLAARNERSRQLRERKMLMAGDFTEAVMAALAALAALRRYKPADGPDHRNAVLGSDDALRREVADAVARATDRARALRGPVWVAFPGRSPVDADPVTISDYAEGAVGALRSMERICHHFWVRGGDAAVATSDYDTYRSRAWQRLDRFADLAAAEIAAPPPSALRRPWPRRETADVGERARAT